MAMKIPVKQNKQALRSDHEEIGLWFGRDETFSAAIRAVGVDALPLGAAISALCQTHKPAAAASGPPGSF